MFIGFVRLGETIGWVVESRTATLAPVAADDNPTYRVYDGTTLLLTGTSSPFDSSEITGGYRISIEASTANGFERGHTYTIVALWEINGGDRQEIATFSVV